MARLIVDGMSVMKTLAGQAAHLDRGYAYSFLTQVTSAVKKLKPTGVHVCWEGGHSKRSEVLPGYKSDRVSSGDGLVADRDTTKLLMTALGVHQHFAPGHEADDVIASLANDRNRDSVIMSADKDMLQLVGPHCSVYRKVVTTGRKAERMKITSKNFQECTGWYNPAMYLQAHCALGDKVDQIPKLAGVGEPVVHAYFMGMKIPAKKQALLEEFYADSPQYLMNKKLIDLTQTVGLEMETTPGAWSEQAAFRLLEELGFGSMAAKFDTWIIPWHEACGNADVSTLP